MEARFGPFGNSANLDGRLEHGFASNIPLAQKSFWTHSMELLGDGAQVEARFGPFGDIANPNAR